MARTHFQFTPAAIGLSFVVIIALLFAWYVFTPGRYDAFARCLGERGATFYGAFWCPHCQEQKQLFGKSAKKLPYIECSNPDGKTQTAVCESAGVTSYPTWKFSEDSSTVNGIMSLDALVEKTGCELPLSK